MDTKEFSKKLIKAYDEAFMKGNTKPRRYIINESAGIQQQPQ